ncbi:Transposase IS116/IS110/IS902 family protein [Pseudovibrio ascidiaceicola]|uniref:Transposase IS116/IS110/IS902 family protein n=1 Tax=Pseudovibrio ascidiaceicola TaxID=285279 RepID=A0A1I4BL09_9HYPH|nr:Transposase IS116/IS110/IS902 family protein [Pseudovibrio ascidiaceicola]
MRTGNSSLRNSLFAILDKRADEISPRMHDILIGLYEDWLWLDERIDAISTEIEEISQYDGGCQLLMSIPGIGPIISTALVSAIGNGSAFERGRDLGAWFLASTAQEISPS